MGKETAVPEWLDWDLWQGPVKHQDYSSHYVPVKWRGWWNYGCGSLGDIGCHTFDAPFWVLGLGSPTTVEIDRKDPPGEGVQQRQDRICLGLGSNGHGRFLWR